MQRAGKRPKLVVNDEKGKQKVNAWSEDKGNFGCQSQFGESGDESDDILDLLELKRQAPKVSPKANSELADSAGGRKEQGAHLEGEAGAAGDENKVDQALEGLDEKKTKRKKKQEAAQAKAAKLGERARKKEERRLENTERQGVRKQVAEERRTVKGAEKQQRAQHSANYQKLTGKNALAGCCVRIDSSLVGEEPLGVMLVSELHSRSYQFKLVQNPMKDSITWRRMHYVGQKVAEDDFGCQSQDQRLSQSQPTVRAEAEEVDVPYVVLVYSAATFCEMVRTQALWHKLEEANRAHPGWTVCLLIPELQNFVKQREAEDCKKAGEPGHVPWQDPGIEETLAKLCIQYDSVRSYVTKDDQEAAEHIANLTRGHAEAPYRKESTVVQTFGGGKHLKPAEKARLRKWPWLKGLTLLEGVSVGVAEAIKQRYPTLRSLMDAYHDPKLTPQQKASLLKDIPRTIGLGEGRQPGQKTARKIGPRLSEKIHEFFTSGEAGTLID